MLAPIRAVLAALGLLAPVEATEPPGLVEIVQSGNPEPSGISLSCGLGWGIPYAAGYMRYYQATASERVREVERESVLPDFLAGPTSWPASATLRILALRGEDRRTHRRVRRALRAHDHEIEACYIQRVAELGAHRLNLALVFDAGDELREVERIDVDGGAGAATACIETVLRHIDWSKVADAGARVELDLGLRI